MTLRLRLTLWYGALLTLVVAVLLGFAYFWHDNSHEDDETVALRGVADDAIGEIRFALAAGGRIDASVINQPAATPDGPVALWIVHPHQAAVLHSTAAVDPALRGVDPLTAPLGDATVNGVAGRIRTLTVQVPEWEGGRVVVAGSMVLLDESLAQLRLLLLTLAAGGIVLTVGVSFVVSGSALRPIVSLTQAAKAIAATPTASRRVPVATAGRDELAVLGRAFNEMLASIEGSHTAQRRFVGDVSHELRTPLTTIVTNAELLSSAELPDPDARRAASQILRESARLARLVDELLVLARADAGGESAGTTLVQLDDVVMEAFEELRDGAEGRLHLTSLDGAAVRGARDRLKQIVLVLVDNALRYSAPQGRVDIALARDGSDALISVIDEGIGLTPDVQEHAFQRFYRGDAARRLNPTGSGLGLPIARWIVEHHGGSISLVPRSPKGTSAIVRLPLADVVAVPNPRGVAANPVPTTAGE